MLRAKWIDGGPSMSRALNKAIPIIDRTSMRAISHKITGVSAAAAARLTPQQRWQKVQG